MTRLITLNTTTSMLEETLATIDAAGRITVVQTTPATDNELVTRSYVLAQGGAHLVKSANLSDVASPATARLNLGWTNGANGLAAMNVLGTPATRPVTDWTAVAAGGTGFVSGTTSATNGPVAATAWSGHWTALDASNGVLFLVGIVADAFNVWTRRLVAGVWDQWSKAVDDTNYAKLSAANVFTQNQTIQSTGPILILNDTDAAVGGSPTANIVVRSGANTGANNQGVMGFSGSNLMMFYNYNGGIRLTAATAGTTIAFYVGAAEVGRLDDLGTLPVGASIITKTTGDARYASRATDGAIKLPTMTKAVANGLASKLVAGSMVYVTDATGGATLATSNGTTWKIAGTQTDI